MGVFSDQTANLATQLWLVGQYLQSLSMVIAPLYIGRRLKAYPLLAVLIVLTILILTSIFYWNNFPIAYIDGLGLTPFKKISEYLISFFFLISTGLLIWKRREFDPSVLNYLILFNVFTIGSELAFSSYVQVYGEANLIGHFLRLIAFYFLYKALIETGLVRPFNILLRNLKLSEDRLREHTAALQVRNAELDAYAHTVAHNLKNPLTVIITTSDVITDISNLTRKELKEFTEQIRSTAFQMNTIIDNLLLLAEVRKADAPKETIDMARIVANLRHRLRSMLRETHAQLTCPASWPKAVGYTPWIEEIWVNYITNALKYGGKPPRVELGASIQEDGQVRFWVHDNGPGLTPEDQKRLFIPFSQIGQSHEAGHGLGLSIVRRIVEKLGGQVGVESKVGKGSSFYFTLPAAPADEKTETDKLRPALKKAPKSRLTQA